MERRQTDRAGRFSSLLSTGASLYLAGALLVLGLVLVNGALFFVETGGIRRATTQLTESAMYGRSRGFVRRSFVDEAGVDHPYMVFVPHAMRERDRLPLAVYLNGQGENGNDGLMFMKNGLAQAIWEDERLFPFVVVWPQCSFGETWTALGESAERAIQIMQRAQEEFHTDPDRVYLTGISSGGTGVWHLGGWCPELFAALIPNSAASAKVQEIAEAELPLWNNFVKQDEHELKTRFGESVHRGLLDAGLSPHSCEMRAFTGDVHNSWSFTFRNGGFYRWLAKQNRASRAEAARRYTRVELRVPEGSAPAEPATPDDARFAVKLRIPAERAEDFALLESDLLVKELAELHFEFLADPGISRFGVGFFAPPNAGVEGEAGTSFELAVDDLSSGGLYVWPAHRPARALPSPGDQALRAGGWNDLRLSNAAGRLSIEINGWNLLDDAEMDVPDRGAVSFLARGLTGSAVEIRNVRIRKGNGPSGGSALAPKPLVANATLRRVTAPRGTHSFTLEEVLEGWRRREESHPHVRLEWTLDRGMRFAPWLFRSAEARSTSGAPAGSKAGEVAPEDRGEITISPEGLRYTTGWGHWRTDVSRDAGLSGEPGVRDYDEALRSRFTNSPRHKRGALRLEVRVDPVRRVDELYDAKGRGCRGVVFDRPDVWPQRVGKMDDLLWRAPLIMYRALARDGAACASEACALLPEPVWMEGTECVVVEETTPGEQTIRRRFWVDPRRDFLVVRSATFVDGLLREQLDMNYADESPAGWKLASWVALRKGGRERTITSEAPFPGCEWLFEALRAEVTRCDTDPVTPAHRPIDHFHPGTVLFDQTRNGWFQQVTAGTQKRLSATELTALTTGSGETGRNWVSHGVRFGGIMIAAFATGWTLRRRFRRRR